MPEPERDLEKLAAEEPGDTADILAELDRESKEFDKDAEIERIMKSFRMNAYDVMDLQPGVPDSDIKKLYRKKSLLIHPDKCSHPLASEAFDRLAAAYQLLLDEKKRTHLDEAFSDARMLLMRDLKLTVDSEEVKDPDTKFMKAWKEKVKWVLADMEADRQRKMKAQMQEEGRQKRKEEEEAEARRKKREHDAEWENTREARIDNWRAYSKKKEDKAAGPKKKKMKVLG